MLIAGGHAVLTVIVILFVMIFSFMLGMILGGWEGALLERRSVIEFLTGPATYNTATYAAARIDRKEHLGIEVKIE